MGLFLELTSAISAFFAAGLWFYASRIPTPTELPIEGFSVRRSTETVYGSEEVGSVSGYPTALQELAEALSKQSRWNSCAAICAAVSAFCQAVLYFFH